MLAKKIKNFIQESGLKFNAIAEKVGIPMNTFSAMMNGKRKITADEYILICKALNVSLDFFAKEVTVE